MDTETGGDGIHSARERYQNAAKQGDEVIVFDMK
jgi:hypothetical protein